MEVIALRQLALPEVAAHNRVAALMHAIGEVLARHSDDDALPPLQVALVNEISALQNHLNSTFALVRTSGFVQLLETTSRAEINLPCKHEKLA